VFVMGARVGGAGNSSLASATESGAHAGGAGASSSTSATESGASLHGASAIGPSAVEEYGCGERQRDRGSCGGSADPAGRLTRSKSVELLEEEGGRDR
jgi:hypothetical protein